MRKFHKPKSYGLIVLRLGVGLIFFFYGLQKVQGMENLITFFGTIGFGPFWAHFIAWLEVIGGAFLIIGLFTRITAWLFAIEMAVVILTVKNGMPIIGQGLELDILLFTAAAALGFMGAGKFAIGRLLCPCCKSGKCKIWGCPCHALCDNSDCKGGACGSCDSCGSCGGCGCADGACSCGTDTKVCTDCKDGVCVKHGSGSTCDNCEECKDICTKHE